MRKTRNKSFDKESSLDSFQIESKVYQNTRPPRRSKRITSKKQKENLKYIKMSRGSSAPKAQFTITDIKQESYPDLSTETLKKAIKNFVSNKPERMHKIKPEMKRMHIEYDNYGHLTPHEPYHRLNSIDMKEMNTILDKINGNLNRIILNENSDTENIGKKILSLYEELSSSVLTKLSEDARSKCEFVGDLFNSSWKLISSLLCKILDLAKISSNRSKTLIKESMSDMKIFTEKYEELSKKQPVIIEKEVLIESPSMIENKDQKLIAEKNLEVSINRAKEVERRLSIETKSKKAWKMASIDLCKLSSPSTIQLFEKQSEWSKIGQSYIDLCYSKVSDIIDLSKEVTSRWNDECLEVYTLTYKGQSTLLIHLNAIFAGCSEISRKLTDDYNLYHSGKVHQPEAYQKALMDGKLQKTADNLLAWSVVVQQWIELEYNELINEARNLTLNLDDDFRNFLNMIENSIVKKHFSNENINELRSLHQRMTTILKRITMPINEQTKQILRPILISFKEWGKLFKEAVDGKSNRVLLSNGYIDPMSMITFVKQLDENTENLQKFTQRRIEEIQELQMSLPSFTTDITKICNDLTQNVSASLQTLQNMLDENIEIALAWSLLYGAGVQGPFSLQKNQLLRSDFEKTYRGQFQNWMNILKEDFDEVLHEKAFEQFELFLDDWFVTAKNCVLQKCQFYYSAQVQTDPISTEIKLSKSDDNSLSSSSGMLPTVMQGDTNPEFDISGIGLSKCETLFELKPFILDDHFVSPHKRMKHFSKKSFHLFSRGSPGINSSASISILAPHSPSPPSPHFSSNKKNSSSKKVTGKPRPLPWLLSIIAELYEFRLSTVSKTKVANISLFYNPFDMQTCFLNFLRTKYGVKAKMAKLISDFDATLFLYKDHDPAIFALYMFKSGEWSSYCFDFYLMCRSILPKGTNFNFNHFAELVFSTFGDMPTFSVLSALNLYHPKNKDELLVTLASTFSSVVTGRRNESLSLFNANSTFFPMKTDNHNSETSDDDKINSVQLLTMSSFMRLASAINPIGSIETYRKVFHSIISYSLTEDEPSKIKTKGKAKNKKNEEPKIQQGLTFDQFEIALLYCGLFSQQNIALNVDPFNMLPDMVFGEIKKSINDGENRKALTQLSRLIVTMVHEMPPSDPSVIEIIKCELRASQIIMRKEISDKILSIGDDSQPIDDDNDDKKDDINDKINNDDKKDDINEGENQNMFQVRPPSSHQETVGVSGTARPMPKPPVRVSSQILPNEMKDQK